MVDEHEFLTIEEAMEYMGCSRSTILRYAERNLIVKYVRGLRRRIFFKRSELDNLMNELQDIRPEE